MPNLTAQNLVSFINQLPKENLYQYLDPKNTGQIQIVSVQLPEGPIKIKRYNAAKGKGMEDAKEESISSSMLWRLANAFRPNYPINVDRIFGASYNTRSVVEALLAHTPQIYYCYPGRIENTSSTSSIERGHKHLIWLPSNPHPLGVAQKIETEIVISEIPTTEIIYESLVLPKESNIPALDIDIQRRHAQIQVALFMIGRKLNFRTWIARNDQSIVYQNKKLGEFDGVVSSLKDEALIKSHEKAIRAALLIDCIWFKNGRLMPAVMEVEHSTGVTSGLVRMKNFQNEFPPFPTRYVIVASDEDRTKVVQEANKEQFRSLDTRFFPYSAVEELYALCEKRNLRGITEEFLDCYMEPVVNR